jgi:hypothetical protein
MKQLQAIMYRMVKGLKGGLYVQWLQNMKADVAAKKAAELAEKLRSGHQSAAMKQMQFIMARMLKGVIYEKVLLWRTEMNADVALKGEALANSVFK